MYACNKLFSLYFHEQHFPSDKTVVFAPSHMRCISFSINKWLKDKISV